MDKVIEQPWFSEGLRFKCTECGKCCTGSPGYVYISERDIDQLAKHHNLSIDEFKKNYTRIVDGLRALIDRSESNDCIFLIDNKCSVYESRPSQCRTFPWWTSNLKTPKDWEEASKSCEGVNHPDAPLVPSVKIEEQLGTYLDNLLEQNFSF